MLGVVVLRSDGFCYLAPGSAVKQEQGACTPMASLSSPPDCPGRNFNVSGIVVSTSHQGSFFGSTASFLMAFTWNQAFLRDIFWLSVFWALLFPVWCSRGPPKWRVTTSEVVIPRKVPHRMGGIEMPDQLAYSMRFRGQRHVIRMKLKRNLMPRHFPVFTDNDQGAMQEEYPFIPQDCYYYSYLEGVPGSTATLDICSGGLRGMLQVDDFTYEIKPLEASSKFEHVVSLLMLEERTQESTRCVNDVLGEQASQFFEEAKLTEQSPRALPVYLWQVHMKHMRLHFTISNSLYRKYPNITFLVESVVILNNIIDTIYKISHLNSFIRVLCIWNNRDEITLEGGVSTIHSFSGYKLNFHAMYEHSTSVILTGHKLGKALCLANHDGMCNSYWGVTYAFHSGHLFLTASITAHALGHSIGIRHDTAGCVCFRRKTCIMNDILGLRDILSNCSQVAVHKRLNSWDTCLSILNVPHTNYDYKAKRCGDKNVDKHEECDCGSLKECAYDRCCRTDCSLSPGSTCSSGGCCLYCAFSPTGKICRDKQGVCDLPEYCNGSSNLCPDNFYIQDGTPCSAVSVCMAGNCSDRDTQCRALFGHEAKDGPPICYKELNERGDRFGNCGVKLQRGGSKPKKCEADSVFCGLLHCGEVTHIPGGGEHTTFHHIKVKDVQEENCFGYDAHHGTEIPEMGLVVDGATCGPGKFCRAQNCTFHQDIGYNCDISTCNFRGVCNNNRHCHCIYGWRPPFCDQRGMGGSEDSGPPPISDRGLRAQIRISINRILLVLFIRIFLILVALVFGGILKALIIEEPKEGVGGNPNPNPDPNN